MAGIELNPLEREFLDASRELHEREVREAAARVRRLRVLATVASGLAIVAVLVGGLAALQWRNANEARDEAAGERDIAEAAVVEATLARLETEIPLLLRTNRGLAFALAAQAHNLQPGARTGSLMNLVLGDDPRYLGRIYPNEPNLAQFAVSPDGKYVATKTAEGLVELRDPTTHAVLAAARSTPGNFATGWLYFLPGGLLFDSPPNPAGQVTVFKVPSLEVAREISWDRSTETFAGYGTGSTELAIMAGPAPPACCRSLRLVEVLDGTERTVPLPPLDYVPGTFLFDPTNTYVAVAVRGGFAVLDAKTFELFTSIKPIGETLGWHDFTPDGKSLLTAYTFGNLQVWDPRTGALLGTTKVNNFLPGAFNFGSSGRQVVVITENQKISPVSVPGLQPVGVPFIVGSTSNVSTFFGGDEKTFFNHSMTSNELDQWAMDGVGLSNAHSYAPGAGRAAVAPDGTWFVKQSADGAWARWSLPDLALLNRSEAAPGATATNRFGSTAVSPVVSSDGRYFATAHTNCPAPPPSQARCSGSVALWDAMTGTRVGEPIPVPNPLAGGPGIVVAFHPGLPLLAVGGPGNAVQIWTFARGALSLRSRFIAPATRSAPALIEMAFVAPVDGAATILAIWPEPDVVSLWEVGGTEPALVATQAIVGLRMLGVTPAGAIFAGDGDAITFYEPSVFAMGNSLEPFLTLPGALAAGSGSFARASFSSDGQRMALAQYQAAGGRVSVWDLETKEVIGSSFNWLQSSTPGRSDDAFMALDGSYVVSSSNGATVVWSLDTNLWAEKVCQAAGRNLTEAEWAKYFPGREYEATCPQWPARPKT